MVLNIVVVLLLGSKLRYGTTRYSRWMRVGSVAVIKNYQSLPVGMRLTVNIYWALLTARDTIPYITLSDSWSHVRRRAHRFLLGRFEV